MDIESLIEEINKINEFSVLKNSNTNKNNKNKEINIVKDVLDDLRVHNLNYIL